MQPLSKGKVLWKGKHMECRSCTASSKYLAEACGINSVMSLLGKKWGMAILLELYMAEKGIRFNRLQNRLLPITPKVLSARLKEFEEQGLVKKVVVSEMPNPEVEYYLAPDAVDLVKVVGRLASWGISKNRNVCRNAFRIQASQAQK